MVPMREKALALFFMLALLALAADVQYSARAAENSWAGKAPMPTARFSFGVAVLKGRIYAKGGAVVLNQRSLLPLMKNTIPPLTHGLKKRRCRPRDTVVQLQLMETKFTCSAEESMTLAVLMKL